MEGIGDRLAGDNSLAGGDPSRGRRRRRDTLPELGLVVMPPALLLALAGLLFI